MIVEQIICVIFCAKKNLYVVIPFKNAIDCKIVEIPPKEIMLQVKMVLVARFKFRFAIAIEPFVISKKPDKIEVDMLEFIPNFSKRKIIG